MGAADDPDNQTHAEGPGIPFEDKPYVVADNETKSPYAGNLYVRMDGRSYGRFYYSFLPFERWRSHLVCSRCASVIGPGRRATTRGQCKVLSGVVTPDGTLHVIWSDRGHIVYAVSRDGGKTFSRNTWVAEAGPSNFMVFNANHANGYPQIDMTAGKQEWAGAAVRGLEDDYRNGDVDIFCASSVDGGKSWRTPVRVNSDALHNGLDQLFQWLAVDPASGAVNAWCFTIDGATRPTRRLRWTLARSTDGARTFRDYLLRRASIRSARYRDRRVWPGWPHSAAAYMAVGWK